MVCGSLCGLQKTDDIHDWAKSAPTRKFLEKEFRIRKIPCRAQVYNILGMVNAEKFKEWFTKWIYSILEGSVTGKTIAIDGKTICGTDKLTKNGSILNIVSAYVSEMKLTLGSHECTSKPGERAAFRELIDMLDIKGAMVVADALHCNQKSVKAVIDAEADYLFVVKNNVPSLKESIKSHMEKENVPSHTTIEKNGGRIEKRTAYASCEIERLKNKKKWLKLSCVGAIHREFEKNGVKSSEWHYYISSASLSPKELLNHARLEWGVESMHWLLDVHFAEDKTRVWDMNVQKILNIIRKIALNLVRIFKSAKCHERTPLTSIFKENLFDLDCFSDFLGFFRSSHKLD